MPAKGSRMSDESKLKLSLVQKIRCTDENIRRAHSERAKKQWSNPEQKSKLGGWIRTPEIKERMRVSALQRNYHHTEEAKEKLRVARIKQRDTKRKKIADSWWYGNVKYPIRYDYCEKFNEDLKERVRAFWHYRCFECEQPAFKGNPLAVHHVHYNKESCCDGSINDLVPLCQSCHAKTNFNREYWENRFTDLLYADDSHGKCYFTKEEYKHYLGVYGYNERQTT